jgi:hypothetical protein
MVPILFEGLCSVEHRPLINRLNLVLVCASLLFD